VRTITILYGGITSNFLFIFTCYHYVNLYFGLIEKGVALLIIPDYLLIILYSILKMSNVIFDTLYYS
jgi:hypothetical protein